MLGEPTQTPLVALQLFKEVPLELLDPSYVFGLNVVIVRTFAKLIK